jgi:hypothetical protein
MFTRFKRTAPGTIALLAAILLPTAALGIALLAPPSIARAEAPGALQLSTPPAPSNCKTKTIHIPSPFFDHGMVALYFVSWSDNSSNEAGFTVEEWWRDQSGAWVLRWSDSLPANYTTSYYVDGKWPNYKFRVKAFNASGDSPWSNWSH